MSLRLHLGEDTMHALYQHLDQDSAIAQAGMSPHLQMVARSLHADTHFHLQGQQDRCKTRLGTRPGDSFYMNFKRNCSHWASWIPSRVTWASDARALRPTRTMLSLILYTG